MSDRYLTNVADLVRIRLFKAEVVEKRPESVEVFLAYTCPDMRRGICRVMSRIMTVRLAAMIHGLPLDELRQDLNAATWAAERGIGLLHMHQEAAAT